MVPIVMSGITRGFGDGETSGQVRIGLIADIHPDMLPDGLERVRGFVAAMEKARVDFVVQLGDFCWPVASNRRYLEAWNAFSGARYHVLGNHDLDEGCTREQTVAFCGMPGMHYAFSSGLIRGIVLDGNEPGGKASGYKRFIGPEQLAWLEHELEQANRPVVLFIHQPFDADHEDYLENSAEVRTVLERAQKSRPGSVIAVFSGHLHLDYERMVNGIRYVEINSAAYWWLNNPAARRETYPHAVHQQYRYLTHVAAYRDPLWALVTLDFERGEMVIEGRRSEWVGPDPWTRGETTSRPRELIHPWISDRRLKMAPA
jgi:3',5'-cyclic-AMP phosphodiesterase